MTQRVIDQKRKERKMTNAVDIPLEIRERYFTRIPARSPYFLIDLQPRGKGSPESIWN